MQYSWDAILNNAARVLSEAAGVDIKEEELVPPPDAKLGDLAFGCFKLAKSLGKNPAQIAQELAAKLKDGDHSIETAIAAGPYINFSLRASDLVPRVVKDVETLRAKYGRCEAGAKQQLMLEYANQNTHKELHVGHARVFILGSAVANLLQAAGWDVIMAGYHGDVGAHVAKCLWQLIKNQAQNNPAIDLGKFDEIMAKQVLETIPASDRTGKFLGAVYTQASRALEAEPDLKTEVSDVQRRLEAGDKGWMLLWRQTRQWSTLEFSRLYQDFGLKIDKTYFESEMVADGQATVDDLLKKQIAKSSQGAIVVDLENEGLGVFLIRKSDGTSLYSTKDLALAFRKVGDYPKLARSIVMIDTRQSLYFKQLFRTLQLMGMTQTLEMLGFEFVTLKTGAMSSREGNIVTLQSFIDDALERARKETSARHAGWTEGKVEHTAWCLAMGGIKFGMLKQDTDKVIVFDLEKALSFEGDTGPYVQYAATRLGSILRKVSWNPRSGLQKGDLAKLIEAAEKRLAVRMALFPSVVARAARELKPSLVAQWCLDMAGRINDFYRDVPVLESAEDIRAARLRLVASAQSVLLIALNLLGIPVPEEM